MHCSRTPSRREARRGHDVRRRRHGRSRIVRSSLRAGSHGKDRELSGRPDVVRRSRSCLLWRVTTCCSPTVLRPKSARRASASRRAAQGCRTRLTRTGCRRRRTRAHPHDGGLGPFADRDLVTEAVFENLTVKGEVLARLDATCRPDCVIATNTSNPSTLAAKVSTERRARFVVRTTSRLSRV
jgi:hypothetical protein